MMKHVKVFTDGACRGNPGPGGWGVLLRYGVHEKTMSGAELLTTNNRMELTAAIKGIAAIKQSCKIDLYTDSKYVQQGVTEWLPRWKKSGYKRADKKPVKNIDLWQALDQEINQHDISWHWVKGHSGHTENELVDTLANLAIDELIRK